MSKEGAMEGEHPPAKDYHDPPPAPLFDFGELKLWSFYRALIVEFVATLLFLYVTVATVIGYNVQSQGQECGGVGILGIAWAFGGMIFILVYCTAGISGGHINPAVTLGLFLARKVSLVRAVLYMVAQCLGAICGVGIVKGIMKHPFNQFGGGANSVAAGYSRGTALGAEIIGTFVLVYTVFSATDPKRSARDSHVPVNIIHTPATFTVSSPGSSRVGSTNIWGRYRCWLPCPLGSPCSWCIWRRSPSPAPASTPRGVSERSSSTTRANHGMITGSSGSVHSSELWRRPCTTSSC